MTLNPFAGIYNKHQELRASLIKKIRDTFLVFWGNPLEIDTEPRWGLFDYFTLGILVLNLHEFVAILGNKNENISMQFILKLIAFLGIISCHTVDLLLRFLISSILTIILIPLVVLVHAISNELKRRVVKKEVYTTIQACLDQDSNSLTIEDIPINLKEWSEARTNYFIEQLNHNRGITKLTVNYSYADTELLLQFGLKLKHVTNLSIPKMEFKEICLELAPQPSEEVEKVFVDPSKNLLRFLMENTKIDELEVYDVVLSKDSIDKFNQMINKKEIKHICKLSTPISSPEKMSEHINDCFLLNSCFEFYKIMVTPWSAIRDNFGGINQNVTKLILMTLLQGCSQDIVQRSKQGLIKSGFFSQQPRLVTVDSQDEMHLNLVNNEI